MKKYEIITIPATNLSEVTQKVTSFDNNLSQQISTMHQVLKNHDGAGLAANQINLNNQVLIVELIDKNPKNSIPFQAFINPEIVDFSQEKESLEEGCLSVPQIELPIERSTKIKVRFQNESGKKQKITAKDLLARILQHEIDHLNGVVFTTKVKEKFLQDHPQFKTAKIAFFGSGEFGATILQGLILLGLNLEIFTEKAKPSGRKQELKTTPVAEMAKRFGKKYLYSSELFVSQSNSHRPNLHGSPSGENLAERVGSDESLDETTAGIFEKLRTRLPDLIICADFGKKIPDDVLKMAKIAAINLHPSLLPKFRGPSPIQSAILSGEKETGVSIIKMTNKIDQGDVLAQIKTEIAPNETSLTLSNKLATLAVKLLFEALPLISQDKLQNLSQDESRASGTRKFTKADGEIDWSKPLEQIDRQIRAFNPWPGAYTILPNGKRLLIHRSHLRGGSIGLDLVQVEGKNPVKWQEFLRGYRDEKPQWFDKIK